MVAQNTQEARVTRFMDQHAERIAASRAFLRRVWNLENDERPGFMIGYVGPRVKHGRPVENALFLKGQADTVRDRVLDPDKLLLAQLTEIEAQLEQRGDYVPALSPILGVIGIPSAFGCEVVWWEDDLPAVRPLRIHDPAEVYDLPMPSLTDGQLGRILDYTRHFLQRTGGRIPVRMTDVQGPLDSAALILGHNNFLAAMLTDPDAVHHLLQQVTDLMIAFVIAQRSLIRSFGAEFVPTVNYPWLPDGCGINIAHDECVMISPALHDEFAVPYLNQISDAFGGVFVHSCGKWAHQCPSLAKVRGLRGLEFGGSEAPYAPVLDYFGGRTTLVCRVGLHRDVKFNGMADFVRRVRAASTTNRGLFINVDITNGLVDDDWPETDLLELYDLLGVTD